MCGRYAITMPAEAMRQLFHARYDGLDWPPRFNIAPSQPVPFIRRAPDGSNEIAIARWGFHPSWMKEPPGAKSMINARSETAAEKPFFRDAMKKRRALLVANGYFEWKRDGAVKTPFFIHAATDEPLVFAALWERWRDPEGDGAFVETVAMLTAAAHPSISLIHDRMPVMLGQDLANQWLDPTLPKEAAGFLIEAAIAKPPRLDAYPVSRAVNSPGHDAPDVIMPA